eukprot:CAMPEP_0113631416 /NCGR_PEP_ID=MMETSP0017_2-20120614/16325_1 /TAXON_ID=2856 /ORGANISM="Cylindrotheca closterium" /LENGTH=316 /DNA_ID=CAMNT_0000541923 /DNA_START=288 /DNA_END=1238 /DNA_ORIENTATION=+ /assembly_acc=CAM_ASM_000147
MDKTDSFRDSILKSYQREEPHVSIAQLLTEQVAREFTTGRRYLLAAAAVKQLSDDFYDVEEQQRVRAVELMEYARSHDIQILDYASQVDKTPIDKSMETMDLLQELLVQEQRDVQLLEQVMTQVSSKNAELFAFLETIRADQMDRKAQIMQTLSDALPTLQQTAVDTATSLATAHVSTGDFSLKMGEELMSKLESAEQLPSSLSRWTENQLQGMGQHVHDLIAKSGHFTFTGATVATVAAVDAVDTDSLPTTEEILDALPSAEDILDALPVEDILQVVDTATTLLEEPSQLVDTIQQNLMETEALSQIVDIVTGLY